MPNYRKFDADEESVKSKANKNEKRLAKKLGGRRQPASGAIDGYKGDIITKEYLYDDKSTKHFSLPLKFEMLQKLAKEAIDSHREPVLAVTFDSVKIGEKDFVVIPMSLWQELTGEQ